MAKVELNVVVVNAEEVKKALLRLGLKASDVLEAAMHAAAEIVVEKSDSRAPEPGNIEAETVKKTKTNVQVDIGPDKAHWYYRFAETGTSTHEIKIWTTRALRFWIGGKEVFVKRARPKGYPPRPFLRPAVDENTGRISGAAGQVIKKAIGG